MPHIPHRSRLQPDPIGQAKAPLTHNVRQVMPGPADDLFDLDLPDPPSPRAKPAVPPPKARKTTKIGGNLLTKYSLRQDTNPYTLFHHEPDSTKSAYPER